MSKNRRENYFPDRNLWLSSSDDDFFKHCKIENYQDSGKGGQKRNRKYSAVRLTHISTGISITNTDCREQNINRLKALEKLKIKMAVALSGPDVDVPRGIVNMQSRDYPLWIAFVLDELHRNDFELTPVAKRLGISNSKLLKLMYRDRIVWNELNSNRTNLGKHCFVEPG